MRIYPKANKSYQLKDGRSLYCIKETQQNQPYAIFYEYDYDDNGNGYIVEDKQHIVFLTVNEFDSIEFEF